MLRGARPGTPPDAGGVNPVTETESLLRRAVLRLCTLAEGVQPELDPLLDALRDAARRDDDPDPLAAAFHALSDALMRLPVAPGAAPASPPPPPPTAAPGQAAVELLAQVLERLYVPAPLRPKALAARARLGDADPAAATQAVLALTADARAHLERDHAGTQEFLGGLLERVAQLDRSMQATRGHTQAVAADTAHLGEQLRGGFDTLRDAGHGADSITALRAALTGHLEDFEAQLDAHQAATAQRLDALTAEMDAMHRRLDGMDREARALRAQVEVSETQALTDALTGIANRLAYDRRAALEFARCRQAGLPLTLVMCDVDHFKTINDRFGHPAGDKVLRATARLLAATLRGSDFVARTGGEEFMVLLAGANATQGLAVAEKLRLAVQDTGFRYRGEPVRITMSCGVAARADSDTPEALFERADAALYQAKEQGRNRCVLADAD